MKIFIALLGGVTVEMNIEISLLVDSSGTWYFVLTLVPHIEYAFHSDVYYCDILTNSLWRADPNVWQTGKIDR